jgi:hypothetical protein
MAVALENFAALIGEEVGRVQKEEHLGGFLGEPGIAQF